MNYEMLSRKAQNFLVRKIAEEFVRSVRLMDKISDEIYPNVGAHFRHNLDFLSAFLNGLETGEIDYQNRERDKKTELNRQYAIEKTVFMIRRLLVLTDADLEQEVSVCSEISENIRHKSSAMRELEFLHSHTVHHHALVAEKLNNADVKVSGDFGVAPSTLKFWSEQKKAA